MSQIRDPFADWFSQMGLTSQSSRQADTYSSGVHSFHIKENGTIYFGNTPLSHRHVELLDRLLRQEFPEEFI